MALRTVVLPECDVCGELWLPDKRLPDGSVNPARKRPELCKRCGKCKSPRWNEKARMAQREEERKAAVDKVIKDRADAVQKRSAARKKCKHGVFNCPICHTE